MSKGLVIFLIVLTIAAIIGSYVAGYNSAMDKAQRMTELCMLENNTTACQWWIAKFNKDEAIALMKEAEKILQPTPTTAE